MSGCHISSMSKFNPPKSWCLHCDVSFNIDFRTPSRVEHCPDTESLLMAQEKFAGQTAWRPKGMTRRLGVYRNFPVVFFFWGGVLFKCGKVSSGYQGDLWIPTFESWLIGVFICWTFRPTCLSLCVYVHVSKHTSIYHMSIYKHTW